MRSQWWPACRQAGFSAIINLVIGLIVAVGIGVGVYLIQQRTNILPFAQQNTGGTCQPPAQSTNVVIEYPACQGTPLQCSFEEASCSWDPVVGAVNYNLTITEVDSGSVIKNEQVPGTSNKITFPVIQGNTYKCDVAAINDCGALGTTASQSLLCQVEGYAQPTPTPTPVAPPPVVAPPPAATPVPTAAPALLACGYAPCNEVSAPCQAGLVCVTGNNGTKICANPAYADACRANPNGTTCCTAPSLKPPPPKQLPPAGTQELTYAVGIFSTTLVVLGILGFMVL